MALILDRNARDPLLRSCPRQSWFIVSLTLQCRVGSAFAIICQEATHLTAWSKSTPVALQHCACSWQAPMRWFLVQGIHEATAHHPVILLWGPVTCKGTLCVIRFGVMSPGIFGTTWRCTTRRWYGISPRDTTVPPNQEQLVEEGIAWIHRKRNNWLHLYQNLGLIAKIHTW